MLKNEFKDIPVWTKQIKWCDSRYVVTLRSSSEVGVWRGGWEVGFGSSWNGLRPRGGHVYIDEQDEAELLI